MTTPNVADGAAWRAELGRWHAELANTVDQACLWAREFHVAFSLPRYPLTAHADRLEKIGAALKMVAASASLDPPVLRWDRTTMRAPSTKRLPGRDPDWRAADYAEGGQYLMLIRPRCSNPQFTTAQQHWRTSLQCAAPSLLEREWGIPQLDTYAAQAQALFDIAHDTVRAAFRDSVAATFGPSWSTATDGDGGARALTAWLVALADWGCSVEECQAALRDIEVIDPQAVAVARGAHTARLRDTA